jgi:alpha-glucosidase
MSTQPAQEWWRSAVIYQVYPRSFVDSDGDGNGDLAGVTARIPYLRELGVDAVWLSPFYVSPQNDGGYDVADYRDVDPLYGTLADFDALAAAAHEAGLRVIVDLVPNHTSTEHPLFQQALKAGPGSRERDRFLFRDGRGELGQEPPNNWLSGFGGPAWTRVVEPDGKPGQWYLHLFDSTQPDWNWRHPDVRSDFLTTLRFWLDRGVDGFRVDVAHALIKDAALPDWSYPEGSTLNSAIEGVVPPMFDQEEIHDIYREWHAVLSEYDGDRMMVAEAWLEPDRAARLVRPDEMQQTFNFAYLDAVWQARELRAVIDSSRAPNDAVGATTTWVLSNHDVVRHATRFGYPVGSPRPRGIRAEDPQPDRELGLRRARAATLVMLALPGSSYLYQGEELGLPEVTDLRDEDRRDPQFFKTGGALAGRDGCRIPLPWTTEGPALGFSPRGSAESWLPIPEWFSAYAVEVEAADPSSTLSFYRAALRTRRDWGPGRHPLEWAEAPSPDVLAFRVGPVLVWANTGSRPVALPEGSEVLISSAPVGASLPADAAVWLAIG